MGSIFDFFDKSESNYNPESYSCIPKIENDYNDLSYKDLKDDYQKFIDSKENVILSDKSSFTFSKL